MPPTLQGLLYSLPGRSNKIAVLLCFGCWFTPYRKVSAQQHTFGVMHRNCAGKPLLEIGVWAALRIMYVAVLWPGMMPPESGSHRNRGATSIYYAGATHHAKPYNTPVVGSRTFRP